MSVLVLYTLPPDDVADDRVVDEFALHGAATAIGAAIPGTVVAGTRGSAAELIALLQYLRLRRSYANRPRLCSSGSECTSRER